ncbi:unnamed protein product, partial [marine sediment metagenome]
GDKIKILMLKIGQLKVPKDRGRKDFTKLSGLMDSIKKFGLIHPCVVAPGKEKGTFDLVSGERRLRAMCLLSWTEIPCCLREDLSSLERKELELEENIQRRDLVWTESVELLRQIDEIKREVHGSAMSGGGSKGEAWTLKKTAELVGKSTTNVQREIQFAKLMNERPDLKGEVSKMPMRVAMRVVEQKLEGEKLQRLKEAGKLKVGAELQLGRAEELILGLEEGSVGLLLTDPPFGIPELADQQGKKRGTIQSYTTT